MVSGEFIEWWFSLDGWFYCFCMSRLGWAIFTRHDPLDSMKLNLIKEENFMPQYICFP